MRTASPPNRAACLVAIINIAAMDLVFSFDSILTAIGIARISSSWSSPS